LGEVYGNPVIFVILVIEGVDRVALCITALTLDGMKLGDNEGNRSFYRNNLQRASASIFKWMPTD
jgi:hypothetical protein